VSGPGCPVCVTAIEDVDRALHLAGREGVLFATFGDMLRVPGTKGVTLQKLRADGADVRVVLSPADALALAEKNRSRETVFMGIGFETTAPAAASLILRARERNLDNLTVYSVHKLIPPAMKALVEDPELKLDGFLCPGHVSTIIGQRHTAFSRNRRGVRRHHGIRTRGHPGGDPHDPPADRRGAKKGGDPVYPGGEPRGKSPGPGAHGTGVRARPRPWRGLGSMDGSGLRIREPYRSLDAAKRFSFPDIRSEEVRGCACGTVLRGAMRPSRCPLFRVRCNPRNPLGPCMVSSEGTCAAYFKYHREREEEP
jgi:hydrogenase expression/formation protein HypD